MLDDRDGHRDGEAGHGDDGRNQTGA